MTQKSWSIAPTDEAAARSLSEHLPVSLVTGRILASRGVGSIEAAKAFLSPRLDHMHEPDSLADIDAASTRIIQAVRGDERVLVYGDYDADGLCATALMVSFLRMLGASAQAYIPNRLEEVYGLHPEAVEEIASRGVKLVVTVDCGVTAVEEAALLAKRGIDLVVTDHHQPGESLPVAAAVVDPNRRDCAYPFKGISGTGVAYKVAWATAMRHAGRRRLPEKLRRFLLDALGLAALGTVADVVDLRDENRALTAYGLRALRTTEMAGLRALMETSGTNGGKPLSSWDIAFKLAPRLNAAGRVGDPYRALDLLLSEDEGQALSLAEELERANRERQSIQARVLEDARGMAGLLADSGGGMPPAVVLWSDRWHVGVVGIAAGSLARDLHRPVVLIATEGARGRGSARSIEGFELHKALAECSGLLVRYGGHAMAAGVTLEVGHLEEFRERLVSIAARELTPERLRPTLRIDAVCPLGAVGEALCSELEALGPFGCGNPEPVVATGNLRLAGEVRLMSSGKHVSFYASDGKRSFRAVGFGMGSRVRDLDKLAGREIELAHRPGINDFRGVKSVELYVEDVRAAGA